MEKMNRLTMRVWLLTILLALTACSKDNDSYPEIDNNSLSLKNELKEDIAAMEGYYKGVWLLNGRETSADNIYKLHLQKYAYLSHQSIEEYMENRYIGHTTSYVHFYTNQNAPKSQYKYPYIEYGEFPWTPVTKQIFPDIDIAYFTNELQVGAPYDQEEELLFSIINEAENSVNKYLNSDAFSLVGYSDNMVYYERRHGVETGYTRTGPIVITTKDGNYFAIVLNLVNATSTVTLDLSSKTLICAFHIKQVEIIDKEGNNTIKTLNPEIKLTFTSTEKIY